MTTEPTQPSQETGPAQASAPGQLQGHRRRRRRRKTKSNPTQQSAQNGTGQAEPSGETPGVIELVQAPPPASQQSNQASNSQNGQQGSSGGQSSRQGGQGRKKKRSRAKEPQAAVAQAPLGNNANGSNGGGQGKKRNKQKGPRQFVGPMDHSYRVANGNIADGPPSTIPFQSNGHGAYYNDTPSPRSSAPAIPENAHTRIFFFIEDLFFLAKIQEASRKLGVKVEFVKGDKEVLARIVDAPENERAALLVFDLNNAAVKSLTIIPKLKAKLKKSTSIIGFLSHLQGDLKMKALEAGCDTVMPRSAFSQSLPNLLRRYGMDEEEDNYPQPTF
jgi:hypothetical protein